MSPNEVVVWTLVSILTVLFTGLLGVNMIVLWLYKKRQERATEGRESKYTMESNPCFDVTAVKQTTDTHLYKTIRGGGRISNEDEKYRICESTFIQLHGILNVGIVR